MGAQKKKPKRKKCLNTNKSIDELSSKQLKVAYDLGFNGYDPDLKGHNHPSIGYVGKKHKVHLETIYNWLLIPSFRQLVKETTVKLTEESYNALVKKIKKGNIQAILYNLKVLDPKRFNDQYHLNQQKFEYELQLEQLKTARLEKIIQEIKQPLFLLPEQANNILESIDAEIISIDTKDTDISISGHNNETL